jgi:hypothetical protein
MANATLLQPCLARIASDATFALYYRRSLDICALCGAVSLVDSPPVGALGVFSHLQTVFFLNPRFCQLTRQQGHYSGSTLANSHRKHHIHTHTQYVGTCGIRRTKNYSTRIEKINFGVIRVTVFC